MPDTIFTKIIKGEIPSHKIYEDEKTYAFLDIHPKTAGHTLVIPKKQVEFVWDMEDEDYMAVMSTVKKVGRRIREVMDKPYVGEMIIGIDVPHVHVHVFSFSSMEEFGRKPDMDAEPDHDSLAEVAKKLAF
jgi:histidine triad (HIT) family protein